MLCVCVCVGFIVFLLLCASYTVYFEMSSMSICMSIFFILQRTLSLIDGKIHNKHTEITTMKDFIVKNPDASLYDDVLKAYLKNLFLNIFSFAIELNKVCIWLG